eukprot:scaffold1861_cov312-Pinguiococcus_pyrenoidosus.AAC.3
MELHVEDADPLVLEDDAGLRPIVDEYNPLRALVQPMGHKVGQNGLLVVHATQDGHAERLAAGCLRWRNVFEEVAASLVLFILHYRRFGA